MPNAQEKPYLLIDVDGVLNPEAEEVPEGFDSYKITVEGRTYDVLLSPLHGQWLMELAEFFELIWATTWEGDANEEIGPRIALPTLPVIDVVSGRHAASPHPLLPARKFSGPSWLWKAPEVLHYTGDRPFAWLDDQFTTPDTVWGRSRTEKVAPTLLLYVDPGTGLTRQHVIRLLRWAKTLARAGS